MVPRMNNCRGILGMEVGQGGRGQEGEGMGGGVWGSQDDAECKCRGGRIGFVKIKEHV